MLPGPGARQGAHARAQQLAIGQHDFHAAVRVEVIAELRAGVAAAAIERITHRAAPTGVGHIDPYPQAALLDMPVEVEVTDTGLDQRVGVVFVDLEHAVHALQIDDDTA